MKKGLFTAIITGIILLICTACPTPLNDELFKKVTDVIGPSIIITFPEENSSYAAAVTIQGTVSDKTTENEDLGTVKRVSYSVLSTEISDEIEYDDEGNFSFTFLTSGLSGSLTVQISAVDANGNVTTASRSLVDEGAFPSFNAVPKNKSVELTWDDIPLAESYTLLYTTNGSYPSDQNGISVGEATSPYTVGNLENGNLHVFQLKAVTTGGDENLSDYVSAIPLSTMTITPNVSEKYGSITVDWNEIKGSSEYRVWRGESQSNLYNYAVVGGTSFTDENVADGQTYYYAVSPVLSDKIISETVSGQTWPFPPSGNGYAGTVSIGSGGSPSADVQYYNGYVFHVWTGGVKIVDVSDPYHPFIAASIDAYGDAIGIQISEGYAYIVEDNHPTPAESILRIFNVSNPASPSETGSVAFDGDVRKVDVDSSYAYVSMTDKLKILSISDKSAPAELTTGAKGEYTLPYLGNDIDVEGDYAYIAVEDNGLCILDISDPATPKDAIDPVTGGTQFFDTNLAKPRGLFVSNSIVYLADFNDGLRILDATNPTSIGNECSYNPDEGNGVHVEAVDGIAYLANSSGGLVMIDVSDYLNPIEVRTLDLPSSAYRVDVAGDYAYVIDYLNGLRIFNIKMPGNPLLSGSYNFTGTAFPTGMATSGDYAYVAGGNVGLQILDISTKTAPSFAASYTTSYANNVSILGNLVFITDTTDDLVIVDVTDPTDPVLKGGIDNGGCRDLVVYNDFVYTAGFSGVYTIDITDPTSPSTAHFWDMDGNLYAIERVDSYLYVVENGGLLYIFDITNPSNPVEIGPFEYDVGDGNFYYMTVYEDYLFVSSSWGMYIVDITNRIDPAPAVPWPDDPSVLNSFRDIKIAGEYAFCSNTENGLAILDLSIDPTAPVQIGLFTMDGVTDYVYGVDVQGNYLYYTETNDDTLRILKLWDR